MAAKSPQKIAAESFAKTWEGKGSEKSDTQKFWMELLSKVFGVTDPFTYDTMSSKVADIGRDNFGYGEKVVVTRNSMEKITEKVKRPVNLSSLRKYNFRMLMEQAHVTREIANAMQGRNVVGVDAGHYIKLADTSVPPIYPDIAKVLLSELPILEWMQNYEGNAARRKPDNYIDSKTELLILEMMKAGKSNTEIMARYPNANADYFGTLASNHGIDRSGREGTGTKGNKKTVKHKVRKDLLKMAKT